MNKNRLRAAMSFVFALALAACNMPAGAPVKPGTNTPTGTGHDFSEFTPTPTPTPHRVETPFATATATMELPQNNNMISDHPAFLNLLGTENPGSSSKVSVDSFKGYFLQRLLAFASGNGQVPRRDRMFGQLNLPVKDFSNRGLNFDWQNDGQGLGFDTADVNALTTLPDVQQKQASGKLVSQLDADGYHRTWMVADAKEFDEAVLALVDDHLRLGGVENPATDPSVQAERRQLFENIVYGEFGVQATDTDGIWQTVDDDNKFNVCETFTANAPTRQKQPEALREVVFDPNLETGSNWPEQDTPNNHDSDNTVLVAGVDSGTDLRVEVFDLSDPTDSLNPGLDTYSQGSNVRAFGGRWLPSCPGVQGAPGVTVPENTPPPIWPTPVPTNKHRDDPNPGDSDVPDRVKSTEIP